MPFVSTFRHRGVALSVMTAVLFAVTGCETVPPPRRPVLTGDPIVDGNAQLAAAPAKDRVLWEYQIAASALRAGRFDEAKAKLDSAIATMGGQIASSDDAARRSRSLFQGENTKNFIGEPYERVMAYYYRGLLYWRDGEPDNARACFRSAQLIDSDAESDSFKGDYVLLDYLDGLATAKLAGDGSDARARAEKSAKRELPPYDPAANVLFFFEFGRGPRKYAAGQYHEQLRLGVQESVVHSVTLKVEGQIVRFNPRDNLNFQATTRGGRVMDYILERKAVFKQNTGAVGDVALVGAAVAADNIYKRDNRYSRSRPGQKVEKNYDAENAAIALGVIGIFSKIASAAATPAADIRGWDNLPQYLSFGALHLPPGEHAGTLEFFDAKGQPLENLTRHLTLAVGDPSRDTVVILSELKR